MVLKNRNPSQGEAPRLAFAPRPVSDYRVVQMRERGLSAIHQVCGEADDKADALPL
jgi:hypothetical protein